MSESKRSREKEEEYPPQAGNTELSLAVGSPENPRTFTLSSPHRHFSPELNRVMMVLPELIERVAPEEEAESAEYQHVRSTAVSTTLTESDDLLACDCSAGAIIVSLVSATKAGKSFIISKMDSSANPVTVSVFGADNIAGSPSITLSSQYDKALLIADGVSTWLRLI